MPSNYDYDLNESFKTLAKTKMEVAENIKEKRKQEKIDQANKGSSLAEYMNPGQRVKDITKEQNEEIMSTLEARLALLKGSTILHEGEFDLLLRPEAESEPEDEPLEIEIFDEPEEIEIIPEDEIEQTAETLIFLCSETNNDRVSYQFQYTSPYKSISTGESFKSKDRETVLYYGAIKALKEFSEDSSQSALILCDSDVSSLLTKSIFKEGPSSNRAFVAFAKTLEAISKKKTINITSSCSKRQGESLAAVDTLAKLLVQGD